MSAESSTPSVPVNHGLRDEAMAWLVRFSGSSSPDAYRAYEVLRYVDRLRGELFAARQATLSEGLRTDEPYLPAARAREFS